MQLITRKNTFSVFFGIFLVSMLFVPASMPTTEAQDLPYFGAIIQLDKIYYSWTDKVFITVVAPNFNLDPDKWDSIGNTEDSQISILITRGSPTSVGNLLGAYLDFYKLTETGSDTGVFSGMIYLTGFSHDVDGDGKDDPYKLYQNQYFNENILRVLDMKANEDLTGTTSGTGPWDGRIKVNPGNTITVKFTSLLKTYTGDTRIVDAKAEVNFWLGEFGVLKYDSNWSGTVESDNESYIIRAGEYVTVTVRDPDRNILPFVTDALTVNVYSDSDPVGIQLDLQAEELGEGEFDFWQDSGIFHGEVIFSDAQSDQPENYDIVFAKHGDTITFEYADCTLPSPDLDREDCLHLALRAKLKDVKLVTEEPAPTAETSIPSWIKNNAGWWADGTIDDSSFLQGIEYLINEGIIVIPENVRSPSASTEEHIERLGLTPATPEVPGWVKNNAGWWAEGQIDDSSFLQGIQFLIKEGIMVIPPTVASESSGSEGVPAWVKNNAGWWADGQIDDNSFVSGIQYLVKAGIIQVG